AALFFLAYRSAQSLRWSRVPSEQRHFWTRERRSPPRPDFAWSTSLPRRGSTSATTVARTEGSYCRKPSVPAAHFSITTATDGRTYSSSTAWIGRGISAAGQP